jgi:hypothetical protein
MKEGINLTMYPPMYNYYMLIKNNREVLGIFLRLSSVGSKIIFKDPYWYQQLGKEGQVIKKEQKEKLSCGVVQLQ